MNYFRAALLVSTLLMAQRAELSVIIQGGSSAGYSFFVFFFFFRLFREREREREGRPAPVHLAITALVRRVWPLLSAKSNVGLFAIMSMNNDRSRLMGRVDILLPPPPPPPASSGEGIFFFLFLLIDPLSFLCPLGGRRPVPSRFRQVRKENRRMLC